MLYNKKTIEFTREMPICANTIEEDLGNNINVNIDLFASTAVKQNDIYR